MIDLGKVRQYYIACGYTDLRYGIDRLVQVVNLQYGQQLSESSLFLFCGILGECTCFIRAENVDGTEILNRI